MSTRGILLALLLVCVSLAPAWAQTVSYFPQIGDGQTTTIQFQTTLIFVNAGQAATIRVEFFATRTQGQRLQLTLGDRGTASSFDIQLPAGGSLSLQTPGTVSPPQVGYARVTAPPGSNVGGTAVFTVTDLSSGTILNEVGVPLVGTLRDFTLFVDTLGNRDTGLAVVKTGMTVANGNPVRYTLYDTNFSQIATTDLPLRPGEHQAQFVTQIFPSVPGIMELQGTMTVSSLDNLSAVTLRSSDAPGLDFPDDVPTLSAFPVVSGQAAAAGSFSLLSGGSVAVALDLRGEESEVIGAIFNLYEGEALAAQLVRGIDYGKVATFVLPARDRTGRKASVDRVEVELILSGGGRGSRFDLQH